MILRDYQEEIKERLYAAWETGCRSVMCQMPTGTGKTVVAVSIINDSFNNSMENHRALWSDADSNRVLVIAHRKEILEQVKQTLERYGLCDKLSEGSITVESIQKLARKTDTKKLFPLKNANEQSPSLVIIDEAHHCTAKTYRKLWRWFPEAKFLGMTATPCRMDDEGFDDLFDELICADDVPVFIKNGWLSMYEFYAAKPNSDMIYNVRTLRERGIDGDYKVGEMGNVMDNRASIEQLYKAYNDYAKDTQGIIYAINREHALHIKEYYEQNGESVALVDSETAKADREQINTDYRDGKIQILVNCEIFGEGYDAPFVQFIQLARPTLSLSKYLQQVGRGLRPHKDKKATVILDCVGNCYRFGMPNDVRDWQKMFRGGQIEGTHGSCVYIDSKDFRYLAMQARDVLDVDDGHDHEMQQIVSFRDLEREMERIGPSSDLSRRRGVDSAKSERSIPEKNKKKNKKKEETNDAPSIIINEKETIVTLTNDITGEKEMLTLPKGVASDYLAEAWKVSQAPDSMYKFAKNGFYGLKRGDKVVLPAEYRDIIFRSNEYAYVTGKNYANVLVNMNNEVVYSKGHVLAIYEGDIICIDTAKKKYQTEKRFVDLRDKNQYQFESIPLRRKVGMLEFLESPGGIYRYQENTKLPFVKTDLQFDENGVLRVDALMKSATGKTNTLIAFEDDDFAYSLQGTHRDGDVILMSYRDKKLYRWNGKDKPTEWNVNQRDLMLQMKRA